MHPEILALRHQLAVLKRRTKKRHSLRIADRLLCHAFAGIGAVALSAGHRQARNGNCLAEKRVSLVLALEE